MVIKPCHPVTLLSLEGTRYRISSLLKCRPTFLDEEYMNDKQQNVLNYREPGFLAVV
jgi:hypothetical protein